MSQIKYKTSENTSYYILSKATHYNKISKKRINDPKYIFRNSLKIVKKKFKIFKDKKIIDLGCANGEFLNYISKSINKENKLYGVDISNEFIKTAKSHLEGSIMLETKDLFKVNGRYDVIFCMCTAQIFPKIEKFLSKVIKLMAKNSIAVIQGRFNKADCDVIIKFRDRSVVNKNIWRCDFNVHSEKTINEFLKKYRKSIKWKFKYSYIDRKIKRKKNNPDVYTYTFKDSENNYRVTSGLKILYDPEFLIIEKN